MPHLTSWDRIKHGHMARPVRDAWAQMGSCVFIHYGNECQQPIMLRTNTQQPHTHRLPPDSRYIKCCETSFHPKKYKIQYNTQNLTKKLQYDNKNLNKLIKTLLFPIGAPVW